MSMWYTVFSLQAAIFAICMLLGLLVLHLRFGEALLACAFMCPAPLFQVAGGAGSWIFVGDVVAVAFLLKFVLSRTSKPFSMAVAQSTRGLVILAAALLAIPTFATLFGLAWNPQPRSWPFVWLQVVRSLSYFAVFHHFASGRRLITRPDNYLLLQCLFFMLVCFCGLAQYGLGWDLDLWNLTIKANPGEGNWGYGGGFMALYRGAVGGWAIGILAILPIVLIPRLGWSLLLPFAAAVVFVAVLATGSRQGMAIGIVVFAYGLLRGIRVATPARRLPVIVQFAVVMVVLFIVAGVTSGQLSGTRLDQWVTRRFAQFGELSSAGDVANLALSRGSRVGAAWDNITSSIPTFLIGVGFGVEQLFAVAGGYVIVLLDSELFQVWQLGGIIALVLYLTFLLKLGICLRPGNWPADQEKRIAASAGTGVIFGGILLLWGHFFLLNFHANQAPVAYWCWSLLGIAVASCRSDANPGVQEPQQLSEVR